MAKRAKKLIHSPLSKEEVIGNLRKNEEFQKRLKFIKEQFWPLLCETADSIEDASTFLGGINTALMQAFLGLMKEKKFGELKLGEKISGDFEKYKKLIALFDDFDVFTAKDYVEGMRSEIALFKQEEDRTRPLSTLKTKWIDEI